MRGLQVSVDALYDRCRQSRGSQGTLIRGGSLSQSLAKFLQHDAGRRSTHRLHFCGNAGAIAIRFAHGGAMKSILDPTFRYTSSANTDLRKTFARIRRESRRQAQGNSRDEPEVASKVTPIFRGQRPAA